MSAASKLEKLCDPLLLALCNYWQLACMGSPVELEPFRENIVSLFEEAKQAAALDETSALQEAFSVIEKPLVFFIDYMVREGRFSFRYDWQILARSYNELSGDEKFFDLLENTLNDPDAKNATDLFFVMLGLGFDGIHRKNQAYIQQCMASCAQKAKADFAVLSEPIAPEPAKRKGLFTRRRRLDVRFALIASALFMVFCFGFNMVTFLKTTGEYRSLLAKTVLDSIPPPQTGSFPELEFSTGENGDSVVPDNNTGAGGPARTARDSASPPQNNFFPEREFSTGGNGGSVVPDNNTGAASGAGGAARTVQDSAPPPQNDFFPELEFPTDTDGDSVVPDYDTGAASGAGGPARTVQDFVSPPQNDFFPELEFPPDTNGDSVVPDYDTAFGADENAVDPNPKIEVSP
ncbi:MAG: DotU family type IV/VI secretion system protein [Spirochaetaceae bacterium]|jgi:type VI protein secretion system component VasF|nr:DotU family type IV/VI secretion system protein [Spirochaetaceae bacterium]